MCVCVCGGGWLGRNQRIKAQSGWHSSSFVVIRGSGSTASGNWGETFQEGQKAVSGKEQL